MKLPAGTDGGTITNPQDEKFFDELKGFRGAVEIHTTPGTGFILVEEGRLLAAMFRTPDGTYKGVSALACMTSGSGDTGSVQTFRFRKYRDEELVRARDFCRESGLLIADEEITAPAAGPAPDKTSQKTGEPFGLPQEYLDQSKLTKILNQPGVIAVSAFFEGFPVLSLGDADFEHVAASAEDFMRAGVKIAQDMKAGPLEQLTLETAGNKFIIAPCGDLFLCVFTTADTQLGLIRVVLRNIQSEIGH